MKSRITFSNTKILLIVFLLYLEGGGSTFMIFSGDSKTWRKSVTSRYREWATICLSG